jgi:hypothetical protein
MAKGIIVYSRCSQMLMLFGTVLSDAVIYYCYVCFVMAPANTVYAEWMLVGNAVRIICR